MDKGELKSLLNKIFIVLIAILTVLIINTMMLGSVMSNKTTSNDTPQGEESLSYDVSKLKEISAKDLASNTKGSNTVVYIGRESCSWCIKFLSVLNGAVDEHKLKPLYVDIAKIIDFDNGGIIDQESYDLFINLNTASSLEGYMQENFGATPMVLIIKDGKVIDAQTGYVESEVFNEFLTANGFVN